MIDDEQIGLGADQIGDATPNDLMIVEEEHLDLIAALIAALTSLIFRLIAGVIQGRAAVVVSCHRRSGVSSARRSSLRGSRQWDARAMRVAMYSTKPYESTAFRSANARSGHEIIELEVRLRLPTVPLAQGAQAVCVFVNDILDEATMDALAAIGVQHIALRCAGFNNVDLDSAARLGIDVVRVPAYSPNAVAEHTIALILSLNRHIHKAYNRVRDGNFALDGLVGGDAR